MADDHACVRFGVRQLLETLPHVRVVGEASDARTLLEVLDACPCDVLVSDLGMPDLDGQSNATAMLRRILRYPRHPRVVILTMVCHPAALSGLLCMGVAGIVDKRDTIDSLVSAIDVVVCGDSYLSGRVRRMFADAGALPPPRAGVLSVREWEVFRLYVSGMPIHEIAKRLGRSGKTISTQKRSAMRKLGLDSDAALIRYAQQLGLT